MQIIQWARYKPKHAFRRFVNRAISGTEVGGHLCRKSVAKHSAFNGMRWTSDIYSFFFACAPMSFGRWRPPPKGEWH